ncbi:MAG: type II toxin-antitoxin system HicB family antitoxin [Spirochaetales bacterium]|nr:type II toxin-antitoxin system HicB family antitoxin [Spirochaetales bacterium]
MTHLKLTAIIEKGDDGFLTAVVPELKSCYTQAKTIDGLLPRIREVIELCVDEEGIPEQKELVGIQQIEVDVG